MLEHLKNTKRIKTTQCEPITNNNFELFLFRLKLDYHYADHTSGRIVGGTEVYPVNNFPYQLSLRFYDTQTGWNGHNCGGVLIAAQWALSAAHCFVFIGAGYYEVWAGKHNLTKVETYGRVLKSLKFYRPQKYVNLTYFILVKQQSKCVVLL